MVVRHIVGGTVVDPANYDVVYEDNVNPGTARVTVAGKGAYDGLRAFGSFVISSMVRDEYAAYDDLSVRRTNVADRIVYIFTNTTDVFTFRALVNLTLADALVVGGGGGGGNSVGGAGGGGGVTQLGGSRMLFSGQSLTINVGAGGSNSDGTSPFPLRLSPTVAAAAAGSRNLPLPSLMVISPLAAAVAEAHRPARTVPITIRPTAMSAAPLHSTSAAAAADIRATRTADTADAAQSSSLSRRA